MPSMALAYGPFLRAPPRCRERGGRQETPRVEAWCARKTLHWEGGKAWGQEELMAWGERTS